MSLALTTKKKQFATNTQFDFVPTTFTFYKVDGNDLDTKVYLGENSPYVWSDVATGTNSIKSSKPPKGGDKYTTLYHPANTAADVPLVDRSNLPYRNIIATAINDGAKMAINRDLTASNYVALVVKSEGTSVAGKLKIRETGTQEVILAFTTSATAGTWETKIWEFKDVTAPGVTAGAGGMPDFSAITEIEVTLDAITTNVDVAMFYTYVNKPQQIGYVLSVINDCRKTTELENTLDITTSMCSNLETAAAGTARTFNQKITTESIKLTDLAAANGKVITQKTEFVPDIYSKRGVNEKVITAGTITVDPGLKIVAINVDDQYLLTADTATNIQPAAYHYSGSTITFNTALNGKVPTIYIFVEKTGAGFDVERLDLGYVGYMVIPRQTQGGNIEYMVANKVQLMQTGESTGETEFSTVELTYKFYADSNGKFITRYEA